jgi:hypothetical protein
MYNNLPLVTFEYPNSRTDYLKRRFVRVQSLEANYLKGYEFDTLNPGATDEGTFKTYLTAKIPAHGIALCQFTAPPQQT